MKTVLAAAVIALLLFQSPSAQQARPAPAAPATHPKLVVIIAVDQMRADYVERFGGQWSSGLKKLVSEGAWFRQADYPYYTTVTCAGHASISTGAPPAVHGMTANTWWEKGGTKNVACTEDEAQTLVTYGSKLTSVGQSAARIMTSTLSDELRLQNPVAPRVVSISLKARSAIGLAGHRPDAVIWLDEETGEWATSTAFAKEPAPFFAAYVRAHPVKDEVGRTWDRTLPKERYLFDGSKIGRQKTALATQAFPHIVRGTSTVMDNTFTDAWESSPYSDAYLGALAAAAIDGLKLGTTTGTDYLGVSFSALDKVGHDFGPESHEVQDVLIRLDQTIGMLLDKLDREVGRANYVVALTADHGVSPVPEEVAAKGFDAGRISTSAIGQAIDAVLTRELGKGPYRTRVAFGEIFFNDGVYDKLLQNPKAMDDVIRAIENAPGIRRVYKKEQLMSIENELDPLIHAAALSRYPGRNGELFMVARAYWIAGASTVTHGSAHRYDTHVPVILFGADIKKGQYPQPSSPLDIAPTLAFLSGVTLPYATGRVLAEALEGRK